MEALDDYLAKLASDAPAPGGGSAAMVVGAAGCALVSMVARICAGSPKYGDKADLTAHLIAAADAARVRFLELKGQDEQAFEAVVAARGDKAAMQRALTNAAGVPLEGARQALSALTLAADGLALGNANLVSDLSCAAEFTHAALIACAYNVRINHKYMREADDLIAEQSAELQRLEREAEPLLRKLREAMR